MTRRWQFRCEVESDHGQTLVEYSLILMLVALVAIAVLTQIGTTVNGFLQSIATQI